MADDSFGQLRKDFARDGFEKLDLPSDRCLRFEDATLWFPDGYQANGATLGLMFATWPAIAGFIGAAVGIHDGYTWGWYSLLAGVLGCGVFLATLRRHRRKKRAKVESLSCGVFLFSDRIVVREPGYDRVRTRKSFVATKVRSARDQRDYRRHYLTLVAKDGQEDLHTELDKTSQKLVNRWILGIKATSPDTDIAS